MTRREAVIISGPLGADWCSGAALTAPGDGAIASFLGVVRDHARGRAVTALHYDCYRPMAERVLGELIAEAATRCDPQLSAIVAHGTGDMVPGEVSVAIHVASAHRVAAFDACRHLIERLKQDLPIWKRERYAEGDEAWLKGS